MIEIVHPATGNSAVVDDEAAGHYAASGWITRAQLNANEAERQAREAARLVAEAQAESERQAAEQAAAGSVKAPRAGKEG